MQTKSEDIWVLTINSNCGVEQFVFRTGDEAVGFLREFDEDLTKALNADEGWESSLVADGGISAGWADIMLRKCILD